MYDVIVLGGSYSGLAAALQLGRARRRVLVLDAGERRNRNAAHSHGYLGQDGESPAAIAAKGRAEVLAYPTVSWRDAAATEAQSIDSGFAVRTASDEYRSKRLILATGVVDVLPDIPGLAERWGRSVFHCPYCHGYELDRGRIGVLATVPHSVHFAQLVSEWAGSARTLFLNGAFELDAAQRDELAAHDIRVEPERVEAIEGDAPRVDVRLGDGRMVALDGLFVPSSTHIKSSFAEQLGLELEDGMVGRFYKTDAMKETNVPGVFACGDAALGMHSVTLAVADGVKAGIGAHRSLVFPR